MAPEGKRHSAWEEHPRAGVFWLRNRGEESGERCLGSAVDTGRESKGPQSGLPGPNSCQVPRKKRRWVPRIETLLKNKKRPLGLHFAWATSWGARVWCTGWVLQ